MNHSSPLPSPKYFVGSGLLEWFLIGVLLFAYALARLAVFQRGADVFPDSDYYIFLTRAPLDSLVFWAGERPFGTSLLYKLVGVDGFRMVALQAVLGGLCWAALGLAFLRHIQTRWLRPVALACILAFSLNREILQWEGLLFSESSSVSLFALMLAAWCMAIAHFNRPPTPRRWLWYALLLPTTVLWSFTRDTNAYFVLGLGGLLTLGLLVPALRRHHDRVVYAVGIVCCVALFLTQNWTSDVGRRWQYPLGNVIGKRILPNEQHTAFFAAAGMPVDDLVLRYRGEYAHAFEIALFNASEYAHFQAWMQEHGKRTYMQFLLSRPLESMAEPFANLRPLLWPANGYYGEKANITFPSWIHALSPLVYTRDPTLLVGTLLAVLSGFLVLAIIRRACPAWLVPLVLLLLLYPMMFLVWHGDAMEVGRHSVLNGVQLRLALWMGALLVIDGWLAWRSSRQQVRG